MFLPMFDKFRQESNAKYRASRPEPPQDLTAAIEELIEQTARAIKKLTGTSEEIGEKVNQALHTRLRIGNNP